jgi:hypothetical protein
MFRDLIFIKRDNSWVVGNPYPGIIRFARYSGEITGCRPPTLSVLPVLPPLLDTLGECCYRVS